MKVKKPLTVQIMRKKVMKQKKKNQKEQFH